MRYRTVLPPGVPHRLWVYILFLTLSILPYQNCAPFHSVSTTDRLQSSAQPSFVSLKSRIFDPRCIGCHGSGTVTETDLTSYATLMAGASVVPGDPEASLLYQMVASGEMPQGGTKLPAADIDAIFKWILIGAPEDATPVELPPASPSALTAVASSATQIRLDWTDNVNNEAGFRIQRGTTSTGPFEAAGEVGAGVTTFSDTGRNPSTTYYYRVLAYNSGGESEPTAVTSATTPAAATNPPSPPSNLAATVASASQINLTWNDNSNNEEAFLLERSTDGATFTQIASLPANTTSYQNSSLTSGSAYSYRVRARNSAGSSNYSNTATATTSAGSAPTAPSNLNAGGASASQINLTWNDSSTTESGIQVYRATNATGPFTLIATLAANTTTYADPNLSAVMTYYYRVTAYNATGASSPATASATTFGTFSWINTNIIQSKCISCHRGAGAAGGYNQSTYAGVLTRIVAGNANSSEMYIEIAADRMPRSATPLSAREKEAVRTWIESGAANN
ncbi:MAG: fibronectin type III domain-containing protein [Bdellovibrionales bacterium]